MKITRTLFFLIVLLATLRLDVAGAAPEAVTITLPATVIHDSLVKALPIGLKPRSSGIKGTITIDTIDVVQIHKGMIFLRGSLSGRDLVISTEVAGQHFDLQVRRALLPDIACTLLVRFDQRRKTLLLTPKFDQPASRNPNDPAAVFYPLLAFLDNKEFAVELDNFAPFNARIGSRDIPIVLQPVDIVAKEQQLVVRLMPAVRKTK